MKDKFEEIYEELYQKNYDMLREAKRIKDKNIFITLAICIILNIIVGIFDKQRVGLFITICISAIVILIILHKETTKYRKIYKQNIISEIVKKYNEKLQFDPYGRIDKFEYSLSDFDKSFDDLYSEDLIVGEIVKNNYFKMAQITTKEQHEYEDENGRTQTKTVETFKGVYGFVNLEKDTNAKIYIANNSITKKYSGKRIEMDSTEFEQKYDCLTEDKITAMKIFTSDLLEKLIDLKKAKLTNFELKIENRKIYFRSRCGEVFEPPQLKGALEKEHLKKYYDIITLPAILIEEIIKKVEDL